MVEEQTAAVSRLIWLRELTMENEVEMRAFQGDEQLKDAIGARLDQDLAAGVIEGGAISWRDGRGSLVGSLVRGADLKIASDRLGMPMDLLALLDYFSGHIYFSSIPPSQIAHRFLAACAVGADLTPVAPRLLGRLVDDLTERGSNPSPSMAAHDDADLQKEREQLLTQLTDRLSAPDAAVALVEQWLDLCGKADVRRSGWSTDQEAEAQAALQQHWNASRAQRRRGEWPDYPAMFRKSHPQLAAGYEQALAVLNSSYDHNVRRVVDWFIDYVAAASGLRPQLEPVA